MIDGDNLHGCVNVTVDNIKDFVGACYRDQNIQKVVDVSKSKQAQLLINSKVMVK